MISTPVGVLYKATLWHSEIELGRQSHICLCHVPVVTGVQREMRRKSDQSLDQDVQEALDLETCSCGRCREIVIFANCDVEIAGFVQQEAAAETGEISPT